MALDPGVGGPISDSAEELRTVLAASGTGTWRWDMASGVVWWDETLEALSGMAPGTFGSTYESWLEILHPDEVDGILEQVEAAIANRGAYQFEHRARWPDGTEHWLECRGQVTTDAEGNVTGTVGCAVDVTDRRRSEDLRDVAYQRERRLRDRFEFLTRLTDTVAAAADHHQFMQAAAAAAVPKLGDWCSIHFTPEAGAAMEIAVQHSDPERVDWADKLQEQFPYDPSGEQGVPAVIRSGRTEFIPRVTDDVIDDALARSTVDRDELRQVLDVLGLTSVVTVPLITTRGVVGAMQFVTAESGRVYDPDDVALASLAASRVADALDNLWLTEQHRHISATLQRALLPPRLPEIPGIDLAVRYWPAGAAVEAGGDFYDVFEIGPGTWSVLIGDVCGTGPDAAALTGITRHTVRAAARHDQDHQSVLEWLNEAMRLSNRNLFCTAIYATLEAAGEEWRLTTCAAGHPLPIRWRAGEGGSLLGDHGSLLGVLEEIDVSTTDCRLAVGDIVVLYTDGLSDLRPPHARTETEMAELIDRLAADTPDAATLAERLHLAVTQPLEGAGQADDVALVVLRVTAPPSG